MRKINSLLSNHSQLSVLAKNLQLHEHLQQFWQAAVPQLLGQNSFASSLINDQLTVYADNAIVANKIKLTQASLLTQLQNLQKSMPLYRECKVTAIVVKVQVKYRPKAVIKTPRKLTPSAASSLKKLAVDLGESPLAAKLNILASKT